MPWLVRKSAILRAASSLAGRKAYAERRFADRVFAYGIRPPFTAVLRDGPEMKTVVSKGIDPERWVAEASIGRGEERPTFDMPGDGMRYVRDSIGIDTVVVNGEVAWAAGACTDAKSGMICGLN